jgi:hypothetical protein
MPLTSSSRARPHLAFYRTRAGLEPKAQPYGGWDGDGGNLTATLQAITCPPSA